MTGYNVLAWSSVALTSALALLQVPAVPELQGASGELVLLAPAIAALGYMGKLLLSRPTQATLDRALHENDTLRADLRTKVDQLADVRVRLAIAEATARFGTFPPAPPALPVVTIEPAPAAPAPVELAPLPP